MTIGSTAALKATLTKTGSSKVTWTSSNTSVATVSSKGVIETVGLGTTTITAKSGKYSASCKIKVVRPSSATIYSETTSYDRVKIKWKSVSGATGYKIYRSTDKDSKGTLIATVDSSTLYYLDKNLSFNSTYYYRVRSYVKYNSKVYNSYYPEAVTVKTAILKSQINSSKDKSTGYYNVTWKAVRGAEKYELYISYNGTTWHLNKTTSATSKTFKYFKTGKTYYLKVRSYRTVGKNKIYSEFSKVHKITT